MTILQRLRARSAHNVAVLKASPLSEISGAFGDLGTLLPLMIALAVNHSISLSTTLVFSGLWNILTGVAFGIPLPVQPMKAIAAVAISRKFSVEETVSAGYTVAGVVLVLSITGLLRWFTNLIPTPVVKGIQVGAGLSLILSAGSSLLQPLGWTTPNAGDNLLWASFAFVILLITQKYPKLPYALAIFILGLLLSVYIAGPASLPSLGLWHPGIYIPSPASFKIGALDAGLGQIPLTTLNSIVAVNFLASDLLPNVPAPGVTSIGISVALMNLVGGWFGAMPVCHGSGGLAAQYRFGARSGASIIILGALKMIFGFFFGDTLVSLLREYPKSLLGIMVLAAGLELAKVGESLNYGARDLWDISESSIGSDSAQPHIIKRHRELSDEERKERWSVMFMTIGFLLAFKNDGAGFLAGMVCHGFNQSSGIWNSWQGWRNRLDRKFRSEEEQLLSA
ncbi:hypothetical protein ACMFMG_007463 [Clarireedia jacksonii]